MKYFISLRRIFPWKALFQLTWDFVHIFEKLFLSFISVFRRRCSVVLSTFSTSHLKLFHLVFLHRRGSPKEKVLHNRLAHPYPETRNWNVYKSFALWFFKMWMPKLYAQLFSACSRPKAISKFCVVVIGTPVHEKMENIFPLLHNCFLVSLFSYLEMFPIKSQRFPATTQKSSIIFLHH